MWVYIFYALRARIKIFLINMLRSTKHTESINSLQANGAHDLTARLMQSDTELWEIKLNALQVFVCGVLFMWMK